MRKRPVLLYPEGAVLLNDTGAAILKLVDGQRSVGDIAAHAERAVHRGRQRRPDRVLNDVTTYLATLAARELIRDQ